MEKIGGKKLSVCLELAEMKVNIQGDTIDELIEGLLEFKDGRIINKFVNEFSNILTKEQFERLDMLMLEEVNVQQIFEYVMKREELIDVEEFEKIFIKFTDFEDTRTKDFSTFENTSEYLINFGYIINFYKKYKGKFFRKVEEMVGYSGIPRLIYDFSLLEGADLVKLKEAMFRTNHEPSIVAFINLYQEKKDIIKQEDIEKIEDKIIETGCATYILELAEEVKGVNIEKLRKAIIKTKDKTYIRKFKAEFGSGNIMKDTISKLRKSN